MNELLEKKVESAIQDAVKEAVGKKAMSIVRGVSKIASKQGGATAIENYQLLGKRALIVAGVAIVVVNVVTWTVGGAVSRKLEEKRVERIVRRVLAEDLAEREYTEV